MDVAVKRVSIILWTQLWEVQMTDKLRTLLAAATIAASAGFGHPYNAGYSRQRDKQRAEQVKALAKKQRVREQIRQRRADKGGAV